MANVQGKKALQSLRLPFIVIICALNVVFGQIRYSIPEEMERGSIIGNVAEDLGLKTGTLHARRGRLASGRIEPYAELNLESGVLFVNERMDREQICGSISICTLSFQIVIENSPEMYRGELEIVDINDNSPIFPQSTVALKIVENIAPGSRFPLESALDPDVGTNAVTTYLISPNEHFSLKVENAEEGIKIAELLLEKSLDRERQASFQLVLTAVDGGIPRKSGTTQVVITVLDSNDNAPIFDRKIYKASLPENTSKGSPVVTVHASDADEGLNAEVTYSFSNRASKKVQELFRLEPRTGEIRVLGDLDFEEANSYTVDVQAVDSGSPAIAGHSKVLIRITDVNDNDPEIEVDLVTTKVAETAVRGTVVAVINVHDRDSGVNGEVHCKIAPHIPFKLQASSGDHYKLITSDSLDRENTALYNIAIFAWDSGSPPRSTNKTIQIWVSDVNDNAPRFAQSSYTVYVMENNAPGAFIFAAAAVDPDLDQNSYVSYSFVESLIQDLPVSRYLNINSVNGTIYALRSFDYENIKTFQVYVQARDAGVPPLSSTATMNVIILDQNDNAPVIVSPSAESGSAAVEFVTHSVGQGYLVTKIMATDADSGQNARLSYQVQRSTNSNLFNIGQSSGEIRTARNILESDATTQTLVIVVKDNGQPSLSSTITILLTVTDNITERSIENSNFVAKPEDFSDLNLYLIVTFGCTSALFLVTIILLIGIKCNMNRNVSQDCNSPSCCYRLENSNDNFHLRPQVKESLNDSRANSLVYVPENRHYSVCLSPESAKTDFLFLKPCNPPISHAYGTMASKSILSITVIAHSIIVCVPDQIPGQFRYSIPEEMVEGTIVGNIAQDLGWNVPILSARKFRLSSNDGDRYMKVSLDNGLLSICERIDRERICGQVDLCTIPLEIMLENPLEMYRGEVEILDVNDNSPTFRDTHIALQMSEAIPPGVRFRLKSAEDADTGMNTIANYTISSSEYFSLKTRRTEEDIIIAELLLEKPLDRELQSSFQLVLTAVDGGSPQRTGTAQILITVLDINDNPPVFEHDVYRGTITENAPQDTVVLTVKAHDLDEGLNAELTYSFSDVITLRRMRDLFSLDPKTGEIRVKGLLDFEKSNSYSLDIQAVDHGSPALTGHSKVLIKVTDVNDNAPEIKVTSDTNQISENATPGNVITFVDIIDRDSGKNGQVRCEIAQNVPFMLQRSSNHYKLITSGTLDRETMSDYKILISAWDLGSPSLSANVTIHIVVTDINDNAPSFAELPYNFYVTENNSPGASIFAVTASDPDLEQNSYVSYSILGNYIQNLPVSTYLNVNSINGTIYALRSFDYEELKSFQIHVQARDAGVPPLSSIATVNVIILDQNDNAPVIVSPSEHVGSSAVETLPQSAAQGYLVTKILATDADSGQNGRLFYQMVNATDPSLFIIDQTSGEIRTTRKILESDRNTQTLVILVKDNGQPSLSSTVTLHITILQNSTETPTKRSNLVRNSESLSDLHLYLLVIFSCTSIVFLLIIIVLFGIKCKQDRDNPKQYTSPSYYYKRGDIQDTFNRRSAMAETLRYPGTDQVVHVPGLPQYSVCLSPESAKSDFLFLKPCGPAISQAQC
ncbi:uncharacterized protein [Hemitrygon akajei]|uniref:uncharacterized protein n=1 Tax=Hemitrygon akajei TaxID=2704970 RepID=UPI003BF9FE41